MLPASNKFGDSGAGAVGGGTDMTAHVTTGLMSEFPGFPHIVDHSRLRFACVTDVRDSSAGLPARRPGADLSAQPGPVAQRGPEPEPVGRFPVRRPQARLVQPGG